MFNSSLIGGTAQTARRSFPASAILTIPLEDATAAAPRHTVGILTEALTQALNYVGAEVVATVLAPGVHRRGEVRERTDWMTAAWNAGDRTVERLRATVNEFSLNQAAAITGVSLERMKEILERHDVPRKVSTAQRLVLVTAILRPTTAASLHIP